MKDSMDHDLRPRFKQLRTADAAGTPDFRELLDGARRATPATDRNARRWLSRIALPLALAAAVVAAAGIARVARSRASAPPPLSMWTSPTASLLRTPGLGPLAPPHILSSVLDQAVATSVLSKGTN
jgi:hypothetical protein